MKSLILNSTKILSLSKPLNALSFVRLNNKQQFSTLKNSEINHINPELISKSPIVNQISSIQQSRQVIEQQAMKVMNEYITIDEIKSHPGAIKQLIMKLIKVLQYDKENRARQFYQSNKEKLDRIIYDLKSYNSESEMSPKQILLMFYLCKLATDCGYHHKVDGFELRATMKLFNNIKVGQNDKDLGQDSLSLDEAVYGYWLTSKIHCNNHEYKWKVYLLMLNMWASWKRETSDKYFESKSIQSVTQQCKPPLTFAHISSILDAYFMQEIHMNSQYHIVEFLIDNLYLGKEYYLTKEQYESNEDMFLQTYAYLIEVEQHFIHGKTFFEMQEVVNRMSVVIESQLLPKLTTDTQVTQKFMETKTIKDFLQSSAYKAFQAQKETGLNNKGQQNVNAQLSEDDVFRYFSFLNQIRENRFLLKNIAYDHYRKIQFILFEILEKYFTNALLKKEKLTFQLLSIHLRTWIRKQQFELQELQQRLQKTEDKAFKAQAIQSLFTQLLNQFDQNIESITTRLDEQLTLIIGQPNKKTEKQKQVYLTVKQKEDEKNRMAFLKNVEQNFVKPIVDFINANGKSTIMNTTLISSEKLSMIDSFEYFLTHFYGQKISPKPKEKDSPTKELTVENPYFWMLKYMRLQSVHVVDNNLLLKQFQTILDEQIAKNVLSKSPKPYSIISVYNLYGYLCKLQEKMMENEEKKESLKTVEKNLEDVSFQVESFSKKKEYSFFLAYKNYISGLVFNKNHSKQTKNTIKATIPQKYQITTLFDSSMKPLENQKISYLARVSALNKKTESFNIQLFFNIVFRANRYYNHKILCQQLLLTLFGTQELVSSNTMDYITNTNQRSRENVFELIYLILIAENKEFYTSVPHTLTMSVIKAKIVQSLNDKVKGNLVTETLREVIAPRKSSFLLKPNLKYRQKPYSIFQTASRETLQRKKQILTQFVQLFPPGKSHLFGWIEIIYLNMECWGNDRSDIVSEVILPWLTQRIRSGETVKANVPYFLLSLLRLLRFSILRTSSSNQKHFVKFLSEFLPTMFENLQRNKKDHAYAPLTGYLIEIQNLHKFAKINSKFLYEILVNCKENLQKTGNTQNIQKGQQSKYFLKLTQTLDKVSQTVQKSPMQKRQNYSGDRRMFSSEKKTLKQQKGVSKGMFGNRKINRQESKQPVN